MHNCRIALKFGTHTVQYLRPKTVWAFFRISFWFWSYRLPRNVLRIKIQDRTLDACHLVMKSNIPKSSNCLGEQRLLIDIQHSAHAKVITQALVITRPRPKAGDRVIKCSLFVCFRLFSSTSYFSLVRGTLVTQSNFFNFFNFSHTLFNGGDCRPCLFSIE